MIGNSIGGGGGGEDVGFNQRSKHFLSKLQGMKKNWNFHRGVGGGGDLRKSLPLRGGMDIFFNYQWKQVVLV